MIHRKLGFLTALTAATAPLPALADAVTVSVPLKFRQLMPRVTSVATTCRIFGAKDEYLEWSLEHTNVKPDGSVDGIVDVEVKLPYGVPMSAAKRYMCSFDLVRTEPSTGQTGTLYEPLSTGLKATGTSAEATPKAGKPFTAKVEGIFP